MKAIAKLMNVLARPALVAWVVLTSSCSNIYFENPVPSDAAALGSFPEQWEGVYWEVPPKGEEIPAYRECLRLDRLSDAELLVSQETRIAAKDMPRFRAELEQQKREGRLIRYTLTDHFLMTTAPVDDKERPGVSAEQQVIPLFKEGEWYILGLSAGPLMLFDLKTGQLTRYETQVLQGGGALFSRADSLSSQQARLVARQKGSHIYLNSLREKGDLWELICINQSAKGELRVITSAVKEKKEFEQRLEAYDRITPFVKLDGENNYKIAPTDQALEKLLADEHLFQTTTLKKISL